MSYGILRLGRWLAVVPCTRGLLPSSEWVVVSLAILLLIFHRHAAQSEAFTHHNIGQGEPSESDMFGNELCEISLPQMNVEVGRGGDCDGVGHDGRWETRARSRVSRNGNAWLEKGHAAVGVAFRPPKLQPSHHDPPTQQPSRPAQRRRQLF